jgi:hypothetical protein
VLKSASPFFVSGGGYMAVNRLTVALEQPEYSGLLEVSAKELRDPRDQLRHILRKELRERGLLPRTTEAQQQRQGAQND